MGIVFTMSYFSLCVSLPDGAVEGYYLQELGGAGGVSLENVSLV